MNDINKAKKTALCLAEDSFTRGLLFNSMPSEDATDWGLGDPETVATIVSMSISEGVGGMTMDEAEIEITQSLESIYTHLPEPPEMISSSFLTESIKGFDSFDMLQAILKNPEIVQNKEILTCLRKRDFENASAL